MSLEQTEAKILATKPVAPRVSLDDLKSNIQHVEYCKFVTHSGQILRWCVLTVKNGFSVTGKPSAAVCSENDNAQMGEEIAYKNAIDELWPLMGYALRESLSK